MKLTTLTTLAAVALAAPGVAEKRIFLGSRCATPDAETRALMFGDPAAWAKMLGATGADCNAASTNPDPIYDPGQAYLINVWVHVITNAAGTVGNVSDALIHSQIQILNEDFRALAGSLGENGTNSRIYFRLADRDENGNPATGITRSANTTWFNDGGSYWNTLAQDPNRFLNMYTNNTGGLGYVPFLPADGGGTFVGADRDRVVILWDAFGRNSPYGPPYDQGRTATHEVGHYLGLEHTFEGGCEEGGATCYEQSDLICDTNPEANPTFGCPTTAPSNMSCGVLRPIENYMDYSDDTCMELFTVEQTRRIRCSLENWRPNLATPVLFFDGFESGDTSEWSEEI